jgi:hypothetical protein
MFQKNPEGSVTHAKTGLTAEQAASFQRIAWKAVNAYPLSGVKR